MEGRQLASVLEKQLENSKREEADQAKIADEKIQMKKTNAAAVVNDHGKLYAARKLCREARRLDSESYRSAPGSSGSSSWHY